MGLLLNPEIGRGKLTDFLVKSNSKLSILVYTLAILWLLCAVYPDFNSSTQFSENSLLPGLVNSEFEDDKLVKSIYDDLRHEMDHVSTNIPKSWLLAKFRQFNMDAFSHNFTLHYPLSNSKFTGDNIYGIIRAPRASRAESIVISVPFRKRDSIYPTTIASIAYLLAFAKFASSKKYWAKDLIFLVTEHEQLGMKAWLQAYHETDSANPYLKSGDLIERAGAIQAAVNLELHDLFIDKINVKIEGLNGRLPNLDFVNLAYRMCLKQNIHHSFKNYLLRTFKSPRTSYIYSLKNFLTFLSSHATGMPDGNHGIFLAYGIDAVTLEGTGKRKSMSKSAIIDVARMIEGNLRSLNNLLERFHQSFFFYMLVTPNRFISIGGFIASLIGLIIPIFLTVLNLWTKLYKDEKRIQKQDKKQTFTEQEIEDNLEHLNGFSFHCLESVNLFKICLILSLSHCLVGFWFQNLPDLLLKFSSILPDLPIADLIFYGFLISIVSLMVFVPFGVKVSLKSEDLILFNIICHLEFAIIILAVGLVNISLGLFLACVYTPTLLFSTPSSFKKRKMDVIKKIVCVTVNPIILVMLVITVYTKYTYQNETSMMILLSRIQTAIKQAFTLALVDWKIYNNVMYPLINLFLLPMWTNFWLLSFQTDYNSNFN